MKFNLQIDFVVEAKSEAQAEQQLIKYLKIADLESKAENRILDWEFVQFIPEGEDIGCCNLSGCRNDYA